MAVLTSESAGALDMRLLDLSKLWGGTILGQSSALTIFDKGDGNSVRFLTGELEYYQLDQPKSGTILGIFVFEQDQPTVSVTGLKIAATDFYDWTQAHDNTTAMTAAFGGDDTLTGTGLNDYLTGLGGHDVLTGGAGMDTLLGGDGNDHLYGQSNMGGPDGADSLSGGNGSDYLQGNAGNDTLDGGAGSDRINGGSGDDLIIGEAGNDTVNGNLGNDTIQGGADDDVLRGGQGDDSIDGGAGNDVLNGDLGNDTIDGGLGDNKLTGGAGSDVFKFDWASLGGAPQNHADLITDFEGGSDHIAIGFMPAHVTDEGSTTASLALLASLIEMKINMGQATREDVHVYHENGDTYVLWNSSASFLADKAVILHGDHTLSIADFI